MSEYDKDLLARENPDERRLDKMLNPFNNYKVVPFELTDDMLEAGKVALFESSFHDSKVDVCCSFYDAVTNDAPALNKVVTDANEIIFNQAEQLAELKEDLFKFMNKAEDVLAWDWSGNDNACLADFINLRDTIINVKTKHFPSTPCPPKGYNDSKNFRECEDD